MPVDASIPFQAFATTKLLSPTEIQQNALAMQLQKMQLQQAQDAMNDKQNVRNQNNALARALQGAISPTGGVDYGKLSTAQGIDPNRQLEFADQARQLQEQARIKQQQAMDRVKKALLYSDTPQKWDASVDELAKDHPEIAQYKGKYSPELRMSFIAQYAPELLKRDVKSVNLGGKEMFVDTNPNTNPDIVGKTFEKTASPDAVLSDARMRSEGAQNRAVTIRGQNLTNAREVAGLGKAPSGYVWGPVDSNGVPTLIAVKGGPADFKMQGMLNQDTQALNGAMASLDSLAKAANELKNHPGLSGITGVKGKFLNIPGGDAADAQALLNTLKSKVGFGVLQEMRNNSKTGGALGAVSDTENKLLQNNLAPLDKEQSYEATKNSLQKIIDYVDQAKERMRNAYNMKHSSPQDQSQNSNNGWSAKEVK